MNLQHNEQKNAFVLVGEGVPEEETFQDTAELLNKHFDELDPCQIADAVIFARQLQCISQADFDSLIERLRQQRPSYQLVARLIRYTTFRSSVFLNIPYGSKLFLLKQVEDASFFVGAVFSIIPQLDNGEQLFEFISLISTFPQLLRFQAEQHVFSLASPEQLNLLLFLIIMGTDVREVIEVKTKLHFCLVELQGALRGWQKPAIEFPPIFAQNEIFNCIMLLLDPGFSLAHELSDISEAAPMMLAAYKFEFEDRESIIARQLLRLVCSKQLSLVQLSYYFDCAAVLARVDEANFAPLLLSLIRQNALFAASKSPATASAASSAAPSASQPNLASICEQPREFTSFQCLLAKLLGLGHPVPRQTALQAFTELSTTELLPDVISFLEERHIPIPLGFECKSLDVELRKLLQNQYNEIFFEVRFPAQEHAQLLAVLESLGVGGGDVRTAFDYQIELMKAQKTQPQGSQPAALTLNQSLSLLYFLFMRDNYYYDDAQIQAEEMRALEQSGRVLQLADQGAFERAFFAEGLQKTQKFILYGYMISGSPLLASCCAAEGLISGFDDAAAALCQKYVFDNCELQNLINLLFETARMRYDINIGPIITKLQKLLDASSSYDNSVALLCFFEFCYYLNNNSVIFHTSPKMALHYAEYIVTSSDAEETFGEKTPIRAQIPDESSELKLHSLYCFETRDYQYSLSQMEKFCSSKQFISADLQFNYFQELQTPLQTEELSDFIDEFAYKYIRALNSLIYVQKNIYLNTNEFLIFLNHILVDLCQFIYQLDNYCIYEQENGVRILSSVEVPAQVQRAYERAFRLHTALVGEFCDVMERFRASLAVSREPIQLIYGKCFILPREVLQVVSLGAGEDNGDVLLTLYQAYENQYFLENNLKYFGFQEKNGLLALLVETSRRLSDCNYLRSTQRNEDAAVILREQLVKSGFSEKQLDSFLVNAKEIQQLTSQMKRIDFSVNCTVSFDSLMRQLALIGGFSVSGHCLVNKTGVFCDYRADIENIAICAFMEAYGFRPCQCLEDVCTVLIQDNCTCADLKYVELHQLIREKCAVDILFINELAEQRFSISQKNELVKGILEWLYK